MFWCDPTRPKPRLSHRLVSRFVLLTERLGQAKYVLVKNALSQNLLHFSFLSGTLLTLEPLDVCAPVD